jgi:hypothetical protein
MSISRQPDRISDDFDFNGEYGPAPKFEGFGGWSSEDGQPIDRFLKIPKASGGWRCGRIVIGDDGDDVEVRMRRDATTKKRRKLVTMKKT